MRMIAICSKSTSDTVVVVIIIDVVIKISMFISL